MRTEQPLTWVSAFTSWEWSLWDGVVLALAAAYAAGVLSCRRKGQRWPVSWVCCFLGGLVAWALAVNSAVGVYSDVLFAVHMAQHLILIMLVPVLLALGRPLSLWVSAAATPEKERRREALLGSRPAGVLTHPAVGFALYSAVLIGTHLTPFLQVRLENPGLEHVEIAAYVLSGYLVFLSVIGGEPVRWRRVPYLLRIVLLMAGMLPDTLVGVVLMIVPHPVAPAFAAAHPGWGPSLLADQQLSGAIMWFFGDAGMAAVAAVILGMWSRSRSSEAGLGSWLEAARRNTLAETGDSPSSSLGDDADSEEALAAYNAMLARLHRGSRSSGDEEH
ncbi:cytochrome c oxidase assembly protein [Salinifilum ghardaiensis]